MASELNKNVQIILKCAYIDDDELKIKSLKMNPYTKDANYLCQYSIR